MTPRVVAVAAFTAAVCLVPSTPVQSAAAVVTVQVVDMSFTPSKVTARLGDTVTWQFQDVTVHTTTSDQGFWDSGSKSAGQSFSHQFVSAGAFAYHCEIHGHAMRGTVKVPVNATGSPANGWRVRWATVKGAGSTTYDVQVRKPGSNRWTTLKNDVTKPSMKYNPAKAGKYAVRARTNSGSLSSGWSRAKSLTIS